MSPRPYHELPMLEPLGLRHAWQEFGADDELGTINWLTPELMRSALHGVREGRVINLTLPLDEPKPPILGRQPYRHVIFENARRNQDDYLDGFHLQGSSQWDGLRHVSARELGWYGGRTREEAGPDGDRIGIDTWARHGIIGRGVLLDVAGYLEQAGMPLDPWVNTPIPHTTLEATAAWERVELRPADIVLVRTGWMRAWHDSTTEFRERFAQSEQRMWAGLAGDEAMAAFLWDHQVAALAADNPAVEVSPGDPAAGWLHRRLIPCLGFALGELWDLEELSRAAHASGRFDCCIVSVPLNVPRGVGSPANALAVL